MSALQKALQKNRNKVSVPNASRNECTHILQRNKIKEIEKHTAVMESRLEEIRDLKSTVQEIRLKKEGSAEDVQTWSTELEKKKWNATTIQKNNYIVD